MDSPEILLNVIYFVFLGLIGGVAAVWSTSDSWDDLKSFEAFRRYGIAAFTGFLFFYAYSDHGFPNGLMCVIAGYSGTDFINKLIEKRAKQTAPTKPTE